MDENQKKQGGGGPFEIEVIEVKGPRPKKVVKIPKKKGRGRPFGDGTTLFFKFLRDAVANEYNELGCYDLIHSKETDGSIFFIRTKSLEKLTAFYNAWKLKKYSYMKNITTQSLGNMLRIERRTGSISMIKEIGDGRIYSFT